jgi:chromosome segregation ATPase
MKTTSAPKRTSRKSSFTPPVKKMPSIRTNELSALLEEIKNYISSLTEAHEQLNQSLDEILSKVNRLEVKLHQVDTIGAKIAELEDEVHQTIHGHSERIAALEHRIAA